MNDFCREIVQVCIILKFQELYPIRIPLTPPKSCRSTMKNDTSAEKLLIHSKKLRICINVFLLHQSDSWFICNANHLINFLLNQVTQDQANCCIYSILGQLQNCPPDYSPIHFRRWMAHHFCSNIQTLWVKITFFAPKKKYLDSSKVIYLNTFV